MWVGSPSAAVFADAFRAARLARSIFARAAPVAGRAVKTSGAASGAGVA